MSNLLKTINGYPLPNNGHSFELIETKEQYCLDISNFYYGYIYLLFDDHRILLEKTIDNNLILKESKWINQKYIAYINWDNKTIEINLQNPELNPTVKWVSSVGCGAIPQPLEEDSPALGEEITTLAIPNTKNYIDSSLITIGTGEPDEDTPGLIYIQTPGS